MQVSLLVNMNSIILKHNNYSHAKKHSVKHIVLTNFDLNCSTSFIQGLHKKYYLLLTLS